MRIKNKLHYILKYLVLAFPLLLILGNIITPLTEYNAFYTETLEYIFETIASGYIAESYVQILTFFGFDLASLGNVTNATILFYPLWIFYVYLFDMLVDILTFLPRFFHDLIHKDYTK